MDKALLSGSTGMLILRLLDGQDLYGYQMIETLRSQSDHTFDLKAGTLYPLLHTLEERGFVSSYLEGSDSARPRKYYHLTVSGKAQLLRQEEEWRQYARAVEKVLRGGASLA